MGRAFALGMLLLAIGCGSSGGGGGAPPKAASKIERDTVCKAKVGDDLVLEYTENGSIGYHYAAPTIDQAQVLSVVGPDPEPEPTGPITDGGGSTVRMRFRALAPGHAKVSLKYEHRSGIPDQPPIKFEVDVSP